MKHSHSHTSTHTHTGEESSARNSANVPMLYMHSLVQVVTPVPAL